MGCRLTRQGCVVLGYHVVGVGVVFVRWRRQRWQIWLLRSSRVFWWRSYAQEPRSLRLRRDVGRSVLGLIWSSSWNSRIISSCCAGVRPSILKWTTLLRKDHCRWVIRSIGSSQTFWPSQWQRSEMREGVLERWKCISCTRRVEIRPSRKDRQPNRSWRVAKEWRRWP
jgi:hypothetical protein